MERHVSDGDLVRYHDSDEALCEEHRMTIQEHLKKCPECQHRLDIVFLIHPTAGELIDFHNEIVHNEIVHNDLTHKRIKTHLHEKNCPFCGGWLNTLRQIQKEAAHFQPEVLWQKMRSDPQALSSLLPPVSTAVVRRLPAKAVLSPVDIKVKKEADGGLTFVFRGDPERVGNLIEFVLLSKDVDRILFSGFTVLPGADSNHTSMLYVPREAVSRRLNNAEFLIMVYPLKMEELSSDDVITLCWSLTAADEASRRTWSKFCGKLKKIAAEGSLLRAWAEEAELALGKDQHSSAGEMVEEKTSIVTRAVEKITKRLRVEPWAGLKPAVAMASLAPPSHDTRKLVVHLEELSSLGVQPYLRINLEKKPSGPRVRFILELIVDPECSGRYLKPKKGTVEVCLIRPESKEAITVKLGSQDPGGFRDLVPCDIRGYGNIEEGQWEAEVSVCPGAVWEQSKSR